MGQVLHGCATTTEAIRRAIQNSQESLRALAKRHGINPKTVAKWKKRDSRPILSTGPREPKSTSLSLEVEAIIIAFRKHTLLPLDDYALQSTIPHLTRSSLHRCLKRHGISRLPDVEDSKGIRRKFKIYPIGYFHIDIAEVRTAEGRLYLFVAIDRTSKFAFIELHEKATRRVAADFLLHLIKAVPYKVHTILTDNGTHFTGAFALVALFSRHDILMGARRGSSLAVGYGEGEMYIGTDALALAPFTKRVTYLEDDDWVVLNAEGATIYQGRREVKREIRESGISGAMMGKGNHRHFMLKEIHEQPAVIGDTLHAYVIAGAVGRASPTYPSTGHRSRASSSPPVAQHALPAWWRSTGSRRLARLPVEVEVASELRYREPPLPKGGVCIAVSQSGETVDTLAALRYARAYNQTILSVVNVPESAIARESHVVLPTLAGPEIGVASTKAFTTQLTVLLAAAIAAGRARGTLAATDEDRLTRR